MIWLDALLYVLGGLGWASLDAVLREQQGERQPEWTYWAWLLAWPLLALAAFLGGQNDWRRFRRWMREQGR